MGAKRRAGSKSPTKRGSVGGGASASPKAKKAKVEEDPVNDMCQELVKFFQETAHDQFPDSIEATLTGSIKPSLYKMAADRHQLEQFYGTVVGEVLRHCVASINNEVAQSAAGVAEAEQAAAAAAAASEQAAQALVAASENVGKAKAAEAEVKASAEQADVDRDATQEEIAELDGSKTRLEGEEGELKDGLATLAGPAASKKEAAKLGKLLESVGCSAACISAIPAALGKTGGFEEMVLNQGRQSVQGKLDEVGQKLRDWSANCAAAQQKLTDTDAKIAALAEQLAARKQELKAAQDAEKAAKQGKKEAEAAVAKAKKEVSARVRVSEAAGEKQVAAASAEQTYAALSTRAPAPEPAAPAEDAPMA